jgi:hypothetical protein
MSDHFKQEDKSVSRIGEVTHHIDSYRSTFTITEKPRVEVETRTGNFEFAFLYIDYVKTDADYVLPTKKPTITALKYTVRGHENQFVGSLDQYELERITRSNCHTLSDFRNLYESGNGVLLHLADLGLQNETPFPYKGRMHFEFQLLTQKSPDAETIANHSTSDIVAGANSRQRRFTVALLRHNTLLKGDTQDMRFTFLNEQ